MSKFISTLQVVETSSPNEKRLISTKIKTISETIPIVVIIIALPFSTEGRVSAKISQESKLQHMIEKSEKKLQS